MLREAAALCAEPRFWSLIAPSSQRLAGASILIFANKQDIVGALSAEEIRRALALDAISSHAWRIQPCSAATGAQLGAGVDWAVEDVGRRMYFGGGGGVAPPEASKEAERRGETVTA